MRRIHFARLVIISLMTVGLLALVATNAQAVTGDISSTVTIECPVVITTDGAIAFGLLSAPSVGDPSDVWILSPSAGPLVHFSGDGVDFLPFDHSPGDFGLTGSKPITVSVAVTTDFADAFLTLSDPTLSVTSPVDPSGGTGDCATIPVGVGGTLTISPGVAPGLHSDAVVTVTANY